MSYLGVSQNPPLPLRRASSDRPAYYSVLDDIERRRKRELRKAARVSNAERRRRQCRYTAILAVLVTCLSLVLFLFAFIR